MSRYIVGIDQSSLSKSGFGFSVIDIETMSIVKTKMIPPSREKDLRKRIKMISAHLAIEFKELEKLGYDYSIFVESYVMQGKGGESLQRVNGAIMVVSPSHREIYWVSNLQTKAFVGGSGKADKKEIAEGLLKIFSTNQDSVDTISQLIIGSNWDILDSIAIAITGREKYCVKSIYQKPKKAGKK